MTSTDDRIVGMQFDNAQFESKVSDTLRSLDKLKTSLDFANSTKSLQELDTAGKNFSLGNLSSAVEGVSGKFIAMATIGITAISNITNRAVDAGLSFAKSFAFGPITDGFHEFETNMNSIQTILANTKSKGSTLDDVNKSLAELNLYSDKTIYNFTEMARNIGTFTAAGIGLDQSTAAIKGIANLAAISGSNSEQASTAMYQLSQAMASGTVKLMDWNSVVNAGMGGETFQKALFETGKAMKTLTDVPAAQTFDEWKKAGNSFRETLKDGWVTADVLTQTLSTFTGDLTEAQIKALGYTDEQAKAMYEMGQTGLQAATQVKTFTQLIGTIKEAIGSGWTQSFQILFGNFNQSVALFTRMNTAISGIVNASSQARNALLQGWSDLGGRTLLIETFASVLKSLGEVVKVFKTEFRMFFPKETSKGLYEMTQSFAAFAAWLKPSAATLQKLSFIFDGLFAVIDIGIHIIKEIAMAVGNLIGDFRGVGTGTLDIAASFGNLLRKIDEFLVVGGALHRFFLIIDHAVDSFANTVKRLVEEFVRAFNGNEIAASNKVLYSVGEQADHASTFIEKLGHAARDVVDAISKFFKSFMPQDIEATNQVLDRVGERTTHVTTNFDRMKEALDRLKDAIGNIHIRFGDLSNAFDGFGDKFDKVRDTFGKILGYVTGWFAELGRNIANAIHPGDFDSAVSVVNAGLLGGIALMLKKFLTGGGLDAFTGGLAKKINDTLDGVTGTLKSMQTQLKAKALMEIAIAMGVLTASMVALSFINSDNLTKALVAISVGFGELIGSMTLLDKLIGSSKDAGKVSVLAGAMIAIAAAALILAGAMELLGRMNPEDLAKGLAGIAGGMVIMVASLKAMSGDVSHVFLAAIAMNAIATSLVILAGAVKAFSTMSWSDMAKGLAGVALAIGIITAAMQVMPVASTIAAGLAMIPLATGITILAGAVKLFSMMSVGELAKGILAIAGALVLIAGAMHLMPLDLPITAAGMLILATAMAAMAGAVLAMGSMDLATLAKGIGGIAATLLILAVGVNAMDGALSGAAALFVVSAALGALAKVLVTLGKLKMSELAKGLGAIIAVIVILAGTALILEPIIPMMFALGIALGTIAIAFALFGVGAFLVAKAFEAMAKAGEAGVKVLIDSIIALIQALPRMVTALVSSLAESASTLINSGDLLVRLAVGLLLSLLKAVIELAPKIGEAIAAIVGAAIVLIRAKAPDLIEAGFFLLITLLKGLRDHIEEVGNLAIDVVIKLAETIKNNVDRIVEAAVTLLTSFLTTLAAHIDDIVSAGVDILVALLRGIGDNLDRILDTIANVITKIVDSLGDNSIRIVNAGADLLVKLLFGIQSNLNMIINGAFAVVLTFLNELASHSLWFIRAAADILISFLEGLAQTIREKSGELRQAGYDVASAIISGMTFGISDRMGSVGSSLINGAKNAIGGLENFLGIRSPSRLFMKLGGYMMSGWAMGVDADSSPTDSIVTKAEQIVQAFQETLSNMPEGLGGMEFNPVITPVLDLTKIQASSGDLNNLLSVGAISPGVSFDTANGISSATNDTSSSGADVVQSGPTEIKFEQNNYSPKALTTNDIYRGTRSQIAMAKEELNIS